VEIRFTAGPIDTLYGYENVSIIVSSKNGTMPDYEEFKLVANNTTHTITVPVAFKTSIQKNGTIEHALEDTIIAFFKNPLLRLDTISAILFTGTGGLCSINKGIYFDRSADGFIDEIFIGFKGNLQTIAIDKDQLSDLLFNNLPNFRFFSKNSAEVVTGGLLLHVKEAITTPTTYITSQDFLSIGDTAILTSGGLLLPSKITFIDSIAPIIMKAHCVDFLQSGIRDELTVTFSENIRTIQEKIPFLFLSTNGTPYTATLSPKIATNSTVEQFLIQSVNGATAIKAGDSIWINTAVSQPVSDTVINVQKNPLNIKRPITVTIMKDMVKLTKGIYFDRNADGFIDEIFIGISGKLKNDTEKIKNALILPDYRNFKKNGCQQSASSIILSVTEQNPFPRTATNSLDVVQIIDTIICESTGELLIPSQVIPEDSVAPVIVRAHLIDSLKDDAKDILQVWFSERIMNPGKNMPFVYCTPVQQGYNAVLNLIEHNDSAAFFYIDTVFPVVSINRGDSIWINAVIADNITDQKNNFQTNPLNIKRPIEYEMIMLPFDLELRATLLSRSMYSRIPDKIAASEGVREAIRSADKNTAGAYRNIMIFALQPDPAHNKNVTKYDSFEAQITLYDALGNMVLTNKKIIYDPLLKKAYWGWDGKNQNNRAVGVGSYVAVVTIKRLVKGVETNYASRKIAVGVQQ
jgi:hypothetical protein